MLEARTHKYIKEFLKNNPSDWKHLYSFGRIIANFVRKKENLLINSEIFLTQEWFSGILIPLFLNQEDSRFVVPSYQLQFLLNEHLPLYKELGFDFSVQNNQIIFSQHKIFIHTIRTLLDDYCQSDFEQKIIIFADVGTLNKDIGKNLRITLYKKDWFDHVNSFFREKNELSQAYNVLKEKFFLRSFQNQKLMSLNIDETNLLKKIIKKNLNVSDKFIKLNNGHNMWIEGFMGGRFEDEK